MLMACLMIVALTQVSHGWLKGMRMIVRTCACCCVLFMSVGAFAQTSLSAKVVRLAPTVADFAYGTESERQKLDFYKADSDRPTPVVVMIHGGGWIRGDKDTYQPKVIQPYLDAGVSVARINYRFIDQAMKQGVDPPVKACVYDAARAVQTIRAKAKEWNVDPERIGATGGSAGACTSLWLAFHDDLADANSSDPIARESTRLACAGVDVAQTSLDPKELKEWIPNAEYGGHAFGFRGEGRKRPEEFALLLENREKLLPLIREYSPIELVSKDDPPVLLYYSKDTQPPTVGTRQPDPTHTAIYGIKLAEKMKAAGVEGVVAYADGDGGSYATIRKFLIEKLKAE